MSVHRNRNLRLSLLLGTALTLAATAYPKSGLAATDTYNAGAGDGNFNNGSNYTPSGPPGSSDTAVYGSAGAAHTAITFSNTGTTSVSVLNFNASTAYTFGLTASQGFTTTNLNNTSTGNQVFNLSGTSSIGITNITNSSTGGETFNLAGSSSANIGGLSIGGSTVTFTGNAPLLSSAAFTSTGGTLNLSGITSGIPVLGSISDTSGGAEKIILGGNALYLSGSATTTYDGVISGAGGTLDLFNGNNLTLSGANTNSGGMNVAQNSTLTLGNAAASGTGVLTLTNTTSVVHLNTAATVDGLSGVANSSVTLGANALTLGGVNAGNFAGVISGTGSVTDSNTGVETFTGANTYSGGTTVNSNAILNVLTTSLPVSNGVTVSGTLQFGDAGTGTYSGVISGGGGVQITGGGTVTLSGANTFTGTTTINNASTLSVGTGSADLGSAIVFGTGGGTVQTMVNTTTANGVTLTGAGTVDTAGHTDVLSGTVTGVSQLSASASTGTGSLTLSGNNTGFSGGLGINANTTVLTGSTTGLGTGVVTLNASTATLNLNGFSPTIAGLAGTAGTVTAAANTLTLNGSGTTVYAGTITGNGPLTKSGTGSQTLSGANTGFSGAVNLNSGTLAVGNNAALGTGVVTLNGGTLGVSTTGITLVNAATLAAGGGTLSGTGASFTYAGAITGTGALSVGGGNAVTLTNAANTYSGGSTITGTVLNLGANNAAGTGSLTLAGGGAVQLGAFNQAVTALNGGGTITSTGGALTAQLGSFAGIYSGSGSLVKTGTSTLNLSGANTYTGGTSITAGTVTLGANDALGTGGLLVASGGTLGLGIYNQTVSGIGGTGAVTATSGTLTAQSGSFNGTISSSGTLAKTTGGSLVLDGASNFASTIVSAGALEVGDALHSGATLQSPVIVASGGTLLGHGSVGSVLNQGSVSPGGTIGTLTVTGNYNQASNGTLAIEVSPTAASMLAVSGRATLRGGLALSVDPGTYTPGTQYQILTAGSGVGGMFSTTSESGQAVGFNVIYLPTAVDIAVSGMPRTMFAMGNLTPNEANATGAIESILPAAAAGAFANGLVGLGLSTGTHSPQLAGVLGELRADLATVDLANLTSFQNFLVERMDRRQGLTSTMEVNTGLPGTFDVAQNGASDMPLFGSGGVLADDQPSFWFHGYGVLGTLGDEVGFAEAQYRTGGIVAGADLKVTGTTLLGAAVAYEHTDLNLSGDADENNIDTYRISLYGSQKLDPIGMPFTLDAAVGYAFNDYHDNDFLPVGTGFSQTSRHDGNELTAETGLSQDVHIAQHLVPGALTVVPRVGVEYDNIQQNPYSTTGAPVAGLNFQTNGSTLNALRSTIGARADLKLTTDNGTIVTPELRASYLHDFMDTNVALTEAFTGAPTAGFRISGVRPGREAALVGTGVRVGFNEHLSATLGYDAAVRERELDHTVQAGVKYNW